MYSDFQPRARAWLPCRRGSSAAFIDMVMMEPERGRSENYFFLEAYSEYFSCTKGCSAEGGSLTVADNEGGGLIQELVFCAHDLNPGRHPLIVTTGTASVS